MGAAPGGALGGGNGGGLHWREWLPPFPENGDGAGDSGTKTIARILERPGLSGLSLPSWIQEHLALSLFLAFSVGTVLVGIAVLQTWLSSRGRFMLLDGVAHNRGAILLPWRTYEREGNSLFRFRLLLGVISFVFIALMVAGLVLLDWDALRASLTSGQPWPVPETPLLIGLVSLMLIGVLAMAVVDVLLLDFVAPVMYVRRLPVWRGWRPVLQTVVREHPKGVALYVLMKIVVNTLVSIVALVAILCTCCLAAVPYIGTVLLLPLSLLPFIYPLAFLEQLGSEWDVLSPRHPAGD